MALNPEGEIEVDTPSSPEAMQALKEENERRRQIIIAMTLDAEGYVSFGEVSRQLLSMQCQYGCRYINGSRDYPALGLGIRFKGRVCEYHELRIHKDDVEQFVDRVWAYRLS